MYCSVFAQSQNTVYCICIWLKWPLSTSLVLNKGGVHCWALGRDPQLSGDHHTVIPSPPSKPSPQTGHSNQALGCSGGVGLWPQRTNGPSYCCCCCAPWGHCIPTADPWFHSQAPKSAPCQAFLWVQPTGSRHQCTLYYFFLHTKVSSLRCT